MQRYLMTWLVAFIPAGWVVIAFSSSDAMLAPFSLVTAAIAGRDASQIDAVVAAVKRCGALEYTLLQAKKYADLAAFEVESFAQSSYHRAMVELCKIAVERDR